jgi:hypothetical protein
LTLVLTAVSAIVHPSLRNSLELVGDVIGR